MIEITEINKPLKRCTMWWGKASKGDKNYEWFYEPRSRLAVRKQDDINPRCWMYVDAPRGARRKIVNAVRRYKSGGLAYG